jgi:signal transduction histidine kinase
MTTSTRIVAINKQRLLLAFAAFLTAITLALTGLAAYVIERQSETDAVRRLSQQLLQLEDDLERTRELLTIVARDTAHDDKNLNDMAVIYSQTLEAAKAPSEEIRSRGLALQKTVSANRLQLILDSARVSSLAVYLNPPDGDPAGELSHFVKSRESGSIAWTALVAARMDSVDRVTVRFGFPTKDLMALRVIVPIQAVLRQSFNQTIAEKLAVATPETLRVPPDENGATPQVIGLFVFSKAWDRAFLQTVANNSGVFPAFLSSDGIHRLELIDLNIPSQALDSAGDQPTYLLAEQVGQTAYYEVLKRWRIDGDTALVLGAAVSRAGTLASVKQTLVIVAGAAAVILSVGMTLGYVWISRTVMTLEYQVRDATAQLEAANQELESFSYSVSHDLRAPLRSIDGFSRALLEDYGATLAGAGQDYLRRIRAASQHMGQLIDDMLKLAHMSRIDLQRIPVDLSAMASHVADELRTAEPHRRARIDIAPNLLAQGDPRLLRVMLQNLFHNAWKFSSTRPQAHIEIGQLANNGDGTPVYFVRDDGVGFEMAYAHKLFGAFQRLHTTAEFPGTGVGLATVQRVVHRHGGRVWAEGKPGHGATFYFTLPDDPPTAA